MTLILHETADEHAPFKHYIIPWKTTQTTKAKNGKKTFTVTDTGVHVVCFWCGHWVNRPLTNCDCIASCHAEVLA